MKNHTAIKTADKPGRLAAKPVGVEVTNGNGDSRLLRPRGPKRSEDPHKARASRTPSLGIPKKGQVLLLGDREVSTYVGRLSTVSDWHRQVGKIYREMRRHQIDPSLGTKLTYVANVGATLAKVIEETVPKGIHVPPDLSRLDEAELAQLEHLLSKAAGYQASERIELGTVPHED
jgi:hypothetical protein